MIVEPPCERIADRSPKGQFPIFPADPYFLFLFRPGHCWVPGSLNVQRKRSQVLTTQDCVPHGPRPDTPLAQVCVTCTLLLSVNVAGVASVGYDVTPVSVSNAGEGAMRGKF